MSVSQVSIQEIQDARASQPTQVFVVPKKVNPESSTKRYVDRFSDKKIAEFFGKEHFVESVEHIYAAVQ